MYKKLKTLHQHKRRIMNNQNELNCKLSTVAHYEEYLIPGFTRNPFRPK